MEKLRIAAYGGFRWIPPKPGAAGSDKFAFELYPRIVKRGHNLVAYCRVYPGDADIQLPEYEGVKLKYYTTVKSAGFDTLLHSAKVTQTYTCLSLNYRLLFSFYLGDGVTKVGGFLEFKIGSGKVHLFFKVFDEMAILFFWNFSQVDVLFAVSG